MAINKKNIVVFKKKGKKIQNLERVREEYSDKIRPLMTFAEDRFTAYLKRDLERINDKVTAFILSKFKAKKSLKGEILGVLNGEFDVSLSSLFSVLNVALHFQRVSLEDLFIQNSLDFDTLQADFGFTFNPPVNPYISILRERERILSEILEKTTADKVLSIIEDGLAKGYGFDKIAKKISDSKFFGINETRAELIARTEVNYAFNKGSARYLESLGIDQFQVSLALTACSVCRTKYLSGGEPKTFDINGGDLPPAHPNCRCVVVAKIPDEWMEDPNAKKAFKEKPKPVSPYGAGEVTNKNLFDRELSQATQDLQNGKITQEQFNNKLQWIVDNVPDDNNLKDQILNIADMYGIKPSEKEVLEQFVLGNKYKVKTNLDQKELKFIKDMGIEVDGSLKKIASSSRDTKGGYYSLSKKIEILATSDREEMKRSLFHELGHAIDFKDTTVSEIQSIGRRYVDRKNLLSKTIEFLSIKNLDGSTWKLSEEAISLVEKRIMDTTGLKYNLTPEQVSDLVKGFTLENIPYGKGGKTGRLALPSKYLSYLRSEEELFAEGYKIYRTDPDYMQKNIPKFYNYFNSLYRSL